VIPDWLAEVNWQRSQASPDRNFRWGRLGSDYVGEWEGILILRTDERGAVKTWVASPASSEALVEKIRRGEGAAFARALNGKPSLHASGVAFGKRAFLFSGPSGSGKSTMAWHLCRRYGGALLADDVAALDTGGERLRLEPSEGALWLVGDQGFKVCEHSAVGSEPVELVGFVSLRFDDELKVPRVRPVRGAAIASRVLESILRFDPVRETWDRELETLTHLARAVRFVDIERSHAISTAETADLAFRQIIEVEERSQ
jgi:hypothetical protein